MFSGWQCMTKTLSIYSTQQWNEFILLVHWKHTKYCKTFSNNGRFLHHKLTPDSKTRLQICCAVSIKLSNRWRCKIVAIYSSLRVNCNTWNSINRPNYIMLYPESVKAISPQKVIKNNRRYSYIGDSNANYNLNALHMRQKSK
jgi:hypothetical protein